MPSINDTDTDRTSTPILILGIVSAVLVLFLLISFVSGEPITISPQSAAAQNNTFYYDENGAIAGWYMDALEYRVMLFRLQQKMGYSYVGVS